MDKNAIKKFAVKARLDLIDRVSQRAERFGITDNGWGDSNADSVGDHVLSLVEKRQRQALIAQVQAKGYRNVMEEVAYTWFNRFCALRFMEVNGYLPSHVRVFTDEAGNFKPQILDEAIHMDLEGLDMEKVYTLKNASREDELYKYLLTVQCNALNAFLPGMFQKIEDYTELLLPDNLRREGSVIDQMLAIPEDDWHEQVQIIGWLYQYYNTEPKDKVFADLKKNIKITKENIPAATQLFTPDWIVRYMVENSLGRLWVEGHPDTADQLLPTEEEQSYFRETHQELDAEQPKWHYYLPEAEQEPEVQAQLAEIRKEYAALTPEEIKVIDPCMGSGHILAYMFDVLMQIYGSYGYSPREAVASIVRNNIYGLDIDDRAAQLAYFSVMMKARQYDRRFLTRGIQPNVYAIRESNDLDRATIAELCDGDEALTAAMQSLTKELYDAKEYGSILSVTPVDFEALYNRMDALVDEKPTFQPIVENQLLPFLRCAETMAQKYHAVVTNPPYMGASNMNSKVSEFIKTHYTDYKSDFFSAFVIRASKMTQENGFCSFFTPYVWMFIQSYEKLRNYLYSKATIETLIQFEYSAFEEATVPVCTFSFYNSQIKDKKGCYLRLTDFRGGMEVQRQRTLEAIENHNCGYYYEQCTDNFFQIPGSPVAYWCSNNFLNLYNNSLLEQRAKVTNGLFTCNNNRFLRLWHEVDNYNIFFNCRTKEDSLLSEKKWYPYNKGGDFRRWYGNHEYIVNFKYFGREVSQYRKENGQSASFPGQDYFFKDSISWSLVSSAKFGVRYYPQGFVFDIAGSSIFLDNRDEEKYILAYLASEVVFNILLITNPTINYQAGNIKCIPVPKDLPRKEYIDNIVVKNIDLSQIDWDAFETSWNFRQHPLVRSVNKLDIAYSSWVRECDNRFNQLKANEEELNRIFIDIYGLQDELTPEVVDKDVTVRKADLQREIKSLISYAVGCMFGRYSLDVEGLILAGQPYASRFVSNPTGEHDGATLAGNYIRTEDNGTELKPCSFMPDADNIIPICDDDYFTDDIVGRFVDFIRTVYGENTLNENLKFIADSLGGKGQPREVIRNYFLNDFYADHLKIYQKRPIYWLFDSGKKNGFKALIYMHRYQPDTIARIRTDYVHEQQSRYRTALEDLATRIPTASNSDRPKLTRQQKKLQEQSEELRLYEEKIHHLADQMIAIDLDDGVNVNYEKFKDVLGKIK